MQHGMIGLGGMGANRGKPFILAWHECVVYDHAVEATLSLEGEGGHPGKPAK